MLYKFNVDKLPDVRVFGRIRYVSGWQCRYCHRRDMLLFVISGVFKVNIGEDGSGNEKELIIRGGEYCFIPRSTPYLTTVLEDSDFYFAHFDLSGQPCVIDRENAAEFLREQGRLQFEGQQGTYLNVHESYVVIEEKLPMGKNAESIFYLLASCDDYRNSAQPYSKLNLDNTFTRVLSMLATVTTGGLLQQSVIPAALSKILNYISQNYTMTITLDDLNREFQLSKQYIMRMFRKYIGKTVTQYINSVKLRKACELLRHTTLTVGETAFTLGYSSSYYFCRLFKREYHMTPSEYQRSVALRD